MEAAAAHLQRCEEVLGLRPAGPRAAAVEAEVLEHRRRAEPLRGLDQDLALRSLEDFLM